MLNLKLCLITFAILMSFLPLSASAQPLTDAALKSAISVIHKNTTSDFAHIAGYSKLLENPDLTDEQRATVLRYRASSRAGNGDDKLGAVADYARIRDEFSNTRHYENAVSQYAYTYGQIYYMTKRALAAQVMHDDVIADLWGLGYWDQAILLTKERNVTITTNTPLLRDMLETGYLCTIKASNVSTPRFYFSSDGKPYNLDFCPVGTPLKYKSPQTHPTETFGQAIVDLNKKADAERG